MEGAPCACILYVKFNIFNLQACSIQSLRAEASAVACSPSPASTFSFLHDARGIRNTRARYDQVLRSERHTLAGLDSSYSLRPHCSFRAHYRSCCTRAIRVRGERTHRRNSRLLPILSGNTAILRVPGACSGKQIGTVPPLADAENQHNLPNMRIHLDTARIAEGEAQISPSSPCPML